MSDTPIETRFCANIEPQFAAGATGYVALQIQDGQAYYQFELNLENFTTSCDLETDGLLWHVHESWNNTQPSAANSFGCNSCGGHFDPNFACSSASQYASTYCPLIGRTTSSNPPYTYNCSANYGGEKYSYCELGDISGKAGGAIYPKKDGYSFSLDKPFIDNQPVYAKNYKFEDSTSLPWASMVFHCGTGARLVCGMFSTDDLSPCNQAFDSFSSSSSSSATVSKTTFNTAVSLASIFFALGGFVVGFIYRRQCWRQVDFDSRDLNKEPSSSSSSA